MTNNYFTDLYEIDVHEKIKKKNGLNFLPWPTAWAEVKKKHPTAIFTIYKTNSDIVMEGWTIPSGCLYHTDGKTCWVETGVTINGVEHIEHLPILAPNQKSILLTAITSAEVNRSIQRSLTKACARHGIGLYLYEGEDLPEESKEKARLQNACWDLFCSKAKLSADTKKQANLLCKNADENANGDPRLIEDIEKLKILKKQLLGIR